MNLVCWLRYCLYVGLPSYAMLHVVIIGTRFAALHDMPDVAKRNLPRCKKFVGAFLECDLLNWQAPLQVVLCFLRSKNEDQRR